MNGTILVNLAHVAKVNFTEALVERNTEGHCCTTQHVDKVTDSVCVFNEVLVFPCVFQLFPLFYEQTLSEREQCFLLVVLMREVDSVMLNVKTELLMELSYHLKHGHHRRPLAPAQ